ncbi:hypothetical protein [Paenibacillus fonticola]|uniref:hypothetical protein n=1 Tax=Paenibacillus fonticola TaxID=379896 RepID=UPI00037D798D|nr:hypothetical protein [Paenibacillus fonticola]
MRISAGNNYSAASRKAYNADRYNHSLEYKFDIEGQPETSEDQKKSGQTGKLVTSREGSFIRQYLVREDGSQILISEFQQDAEFAPTTNYTKNTVNRMHKDGIHQNTEEMIGLLNFQAGIINSRKK